MKKTNLTAEQAFAHLKQNPLFLDFDAMKSQEQAITQFLAGKEVAPGVATASHSRQLGKNLVHYRERKGFSLQEAQRITGIALNAFEQNKKVPTLEELFIIGTLYGVQAHHLMARITNETVVPASCYGLSHNPNWYTIGTLLELHRSGMADKNYFFNSDMAGVITRMAQEETAAPIEETVAA